MRNGATIQYLKRKEIDTVKWDDCINSADNGLVYGYASFLDQMADNWDGIVLGDYEAVMPLPWRKKWGIKYIYQPFLTAQLGVFGNAPDPVCLKAFLQAIPNEFKLWEFPLNHGNLFPVEGYGIYERMNFVLDLHPAYENIYGNYRENIKRNIRKAVQYGCRPEMNIPVDGIIELAKQQGSARDQDYAHFKKLFEQLAKEGRAESHGIFSGTNQLLASAAFLQSHKRWYYLLVGNHPNGRTLGASHALIDSFIRQHAGSSSLLDFEGSDLRNLAFFYSSFGATEEKYAAVNLNRLPWFIKMFSKK